MSERSRARRRRIAALLLTVALPASAGIGSNACLSDGSAPSQGSTASSGIGDAGAGRGAAGAGADGTGVSSEGGAGSGGTSSGGASSDGTSSGGASSGGTSSAGTSGGGVATGGARGGAPSGGSGGQLPSVCEPLPNTGGGGLAPFCYRVYLDADGDGFGDKEREFGGCCGQGKEPPPPEATFDFSDCDDSDPNVWRLGYPDGDDDGIGVGIGTCVGEPPEGIAIVEGDCDDEDPAIHWAADDYCACERFFEEPPIETNPSCPSSPDLFVYDLAACDDGCYPHGYLRVGNRGGARAEGPIQIRRFLSSFRTEVEPLILVDGLDPLEHSDWIDLDDSDLGVIEVELVGVEADCSPEGRSNFMGRLGIDCEE